MTRGQGQILKTFEVPKVKPDKPMIEHIAWAQGGDFLHPKLPLISMILAKFS